MGCIHKSWGNWLIEFEDTRLPFKGYSNREGSWGEKKANVTFNFKNGKKEEEMEN